MRQRSWLWLFALMVWAMVSSSARADAHPLGNFTINHLAKISVRDGALRVRYVLDIAEIPTFQFMRATSPDARWTQAQLDAWAKSEIPVVSDNLSVAVDGKDVTLQPSTPRARLRPGAAGLPILYWVDEFVAPLAPGAHAIAVVDRVYADRHIGWKDIVVGSETEPTHELLVYPKDLIASPRRIDSARFALAANGAVSNVAYGGQSLVANDANGTMSLVRSNALSDMFASRNRTPLFVLLTMLVAFGLGSLHALEPGHGKALLAFTLVGARATIPQASILAISLTFAHTIGVLILGVVLFFAAGFVSESIYAWITLVSGVAVAIIGARNLARVLRTRAAAKAALHHDAHSHDHGGGAHAHSHAIPGSEPIAFRTAIVAAMSGGIAPCPAAIVVMLAALRLHQIGYGLLLIVIFSMGLAAVLTALGIAVVRGSAWALRSRRFERLVAAGPRISAVLISIVGAVMVGQGLVAQGLAQPVWLVAGIALVAIAVYAIVPNIFAAVRAANEPALPLAPKTSTRMEH